MASSKLIELTYYDPKQEVRLTAFADTIILDTDGKDKIISAIRFGGYPEVVRGLSDAIYGGAAIEAVRGEDTLSLKSRPKGYQRQLSHDGMYTTATLMASDDMQSAEGPEDSEDPEGDGAPEKASEQADRQKQPRKCYIFCPAGDRDRLFEELDRKTAAPLIPAFRDYVLDALIPGAACARWRSIPFMNAWTPGSWTSCRRTRTWWMSWSRASPTAASPSPAETPASRTASRT